MEDEMNAMMGDEMAPMMEAEKPAEEETAEDVSIARTQELTPCCCCLCACSNEYTKDSRCCGCFPIKCGVLAIGIFTVLLTIYMVTMNFFLILNDYIHWYFPVVIIVLLAPMCIGSSFFVVFFTKDTASSRGKLFTACMFGIISTALIALWIVCYYVFIYKNDTVFTGQGDPQTNAYSKMSKKFYLFVVLAETTALCVAYSYFICVTNRYTQKMKGAEDAEAAAAAPVEDEKKEDEAAAMEEAM
tara:strand:+ start:61 stop:792 length:732 start_codon:yes stop_codon:yes gene_type:complete